MSVPTAIQGTLASDGSLVSLLGGTFIYDEVAPPAHNANLPYVVFHQQAGTPEYAMGSSLAYDNDIWTVKAVERNTTSARVDQIAERLDAVLTHAPLAPSGRTAMLCRQESKVRYSETHGDATYRHSGGMYRIVYE